VPRSPVDFDLMVNCLWKITIFTCNLPAYRKSVGDDALKVQATQIKDSNVASQLRCRCRPLTTSCSAQAHARHTKPRKALRLQGTIKATTVRTSNLDLGDWGRAHSLTVRSHTAALDWLRDGAYPTLLRTSAADF